MRGRCRDAMRDVLKVRDDKPVTTVRTTVTRDDGVVSVDGTAVCYTLPQLA